MSELQQSLARATASADALLSHLLNEIEIHKRHDVEALEASTANKQQKLDDLDAALSRCEEAAAREFGPLTSHWLQYLKTEPTYQNAIERLITTLNESARVNQIIGIVVHRSMSNQQYLINLLQGKDTMAQTYSADGSIA